MSYAEFVVSDKGYIKRSQTHKFILSQYQAWRLIIILLQLEYRVMCPPYPAHVVNRSTFPNSTLKVWGSHVMCHTKSHITQ